MSTKRPPSQRVDRATWQRAIASEHGPPHPQTRHVLLTLSAHMNGQGKDCWPSQKLLAERAGLHERVIRRHLRNADDQGWLTREAHQRPGGQNWKYHSYAPAIPVKVLSVLPVAPWAKQAHAKGADTVSGPLPEVRTERTEGADRADRRCGQDEQKVRTGSPLNPSLNPLVNPLRECAPHNPGSDKEVQRRKTIADLDPGAEGIRLCQAARPGADPLEILRKFKAWGVGRSTEGWQRALKTFAALEWLEDNEIRTEQRAIANGIGPRKPGETSAEYSARSADPPIAPNVAQRLAGVVHTASKTTSAISAMITIAATKELSSLPLSPC